ncbi:DUF2207 domain-containing protein [Herbiconiux sp. CPCC 205763]|uniref:DUF2207 domain-containing protein n=1 Tax=Herbiconiux aconitum TaxID=2970913 RepID=A0ABT2GUW3_9MICO|nr:DUF2207 domain-containing protein [Herbiconiux aconitum]MCS5720005.1 DUF2207 domain-containing protein [Herbiconiux aconitum]
MTGEAHDDAVRADDEPPPDHIPDPRPKPTPLWALLSRWLLALEAWLRSHGGAPLRRSLWAFWGVVALAGGVLLFGPVINPPLTLDDITDAASDATDQWIARDFDADYTITRAPDGRLQADVVETIDAFFPDDLAASEAGGIVRVLPTQYQGHALAPEAIEATLDGEPLAIDRAESSDQLTLTLDASRGASAGGNGDANSAAKLTGDHEFILSYTLHDLAYESVDEATGAPVDLLAWDVFGPSWPQAFSGLDVTVTLPDELDDSLVRQPRGILAWTLLGAGAWLEPEPDSPPGQVTYNFTNDQNMPPHAQARFTMAFADGTFTMPPPTPLFLVQTFGPLLPLVFLALTLLLALAARAVAWSDERGRPWFVAQFSPPDGVSARTAAQILGTPRPLELATALTSAQRASKADRRDRFEAAARAANRTGRAGDRMRALLVYLRAPERGVQLTEGFRRIPSGFVRDLFIAAPLALTLLQWGIVRQLSHQTTLAVVWWPVAFVLVSSAVSIVVLAIALSARPLTRSGALVKQHLQGIAVFAERTQLLERATVSDKLLPYVVLTENPRTAGRRVAELIAHDLGDARAGSGWRTLDFVSGPRILLRTVAVLLLAGAITGAALLPNPYPRSFDPLSYSGDIPGTYFNTVDSAEIAAELARTDDGRAHLTVTETLTVSFDDGGSAVPQFTQQWPDRIEGQDVGLQVSDVRVDGQGAPYTTSRDGDTLLLATRFTEVLSGAHEVQIDYTVDSAAVAAANQAGTVVDRVRWAALLEGWEYSSQWGNDPATDPLTIEFRMSDDLSALATAAGWITEDTDAYQSPRQWAETVIPFGSFGTDEASTTSESSSARDAASEHRLDLRETDSGYPFELTVTDLGVLADFPAGTFAGPDAGALQLQQVRSVLPMVFVLGLGGVALGIGILSVVAARIRGSRRLRPGALRDAIWWLGTSTAVSTVWLFVWASSDMPDDWPEFPPLGIAALAAILGGTLSLLFTLREQPRPAGGSTAASGSRTASDTRAATAALKPRSRRRPGRRRR